MAEAILQASGIVAGYSEVPILKGVGLDLFPGETVAVIGPNGAGKSTLLKAIFGLLRPTDGKVLLEGRDITGWTPERIITLGMSYVPQVSNTFPTLTVRENLEMGAYIRNYGPSGFLGMWAAKAADGVSLALLRRERKRFYSAAWVRRGELDEEIRRVTELFPDLRARLGDRAGNLSGGQQQMVALARTLMLKPKILLIDEPSAGLAPKLADAVFRQIAAIGEAGAAIVLVEQNARKALELADRGYVLETGRNRFVDRADRILANPDIGEMFLGGRSAAP